MAVGAENAVHLAQERMRGLGALERMRQKHRVYGIARDRELLGSAQEIRRESGPPVHERAALSARIAQERVAGAPSADLQELLAENALERLPDQALLVGEATPPERGGQPVLGRCRFASHYAEDPA